ncbi:MAG: excinuclease ABC subunit UvrA [Planctomycetaceae bacterium]|nr:excinuclease ABC subunit UvrA [Planctomycetaceae bacterium]
MITLRKVSVHNLKGIDLDLPTGKLIVICGRSGSGKSSLAIDTLYAEGQRRYLETFSARARQFLEKFEKPDALRIDGVPVSVAVTGKIDPKLNHGTVGNITGITDYLRIIFAKAGRIFCPVCNKEIAVNTPENILHKLPEIVKSITTTPENNTAIIETKIQLAFATSLHGDRKEFIKTWRGRGFVRCIILNQTRRLDESEITPDLYEQLQKTIAQHKSTHNKNHTRLNRELPVLIIVDRLTSGNIEGQRFIDSVKTAYRYGDDNCCLLVQNSSGENVQFHFAQQLLCTDCGLTFPLPEPQLFNADSPIGVCRECCGGVIDDVADNAVKSVAGSKKPDGECGCGGSFLRAEARAVKVGGKNIVEWCALPAAILRNEISELMPKFSDYERMILRDVFEQIFIRIGYLEEVGLGYLSLSRSVNTLSGGEGRRVYLSGALGSSLVELMYVLDEPSVGLHPIDSERLLGLVYRLRDNGNTVIVVEHEEIFLRGADQLVEIGLGAADAGGNVIFQGTPDEMITSTHSLTGQYLRKIHAQHNPQPKSPLPNQKEHKTKSTPAESYNLHKSPSNLPAVKTTRGATGCIKISGCCGNNLQDVSVSFPLGQLCVVTGVSGAGKSTLVFDTLYPAVCKFLGKKYSGNGKRSSGNGTRSSGSINSVLPYREFSLSGTLTDTAPVTQGIYAKSPRSNPATYLKIFDGIRAVFASTPEARLRNYGAGRFSFNVAGGRCENCQGEGFITVDMQFMSDMYVCCSECRGRRYRSDTLEVLYRGKNIAEVLEMSAREAFVFFRGQVKLQRRLKRLLDVGLDYIRIGQRLDTLSGGELQRLKLASYLVQVRSGSCLLLFDEPTTGLHFADVEQLLSCFDMLLSMGHSLIVIEHNLQVIEAADHIIDIGPGAADQGGKIIAEGTPITVAKNTNSKIGQFLPKIN